MSILPWIQHHLGTPWQSQYFLWGFPFDAPRTLWLISWLNKCVMLRQALVVLCKCLSWIWWWIYFSIHLTSSTVKSITLYKADTESYFIWELWHYNLYQTHKMGGGGHILCSGSSKHIAGEITETVMGEKSKCAQLEQMRILHKSKGARKSRSKSKPSKTTLLLLASGEWE